MKESPIPFTADMVRAVLDGRKTQTRRLVKTQPSPIGNNIARPDGRPSHNTRCPYGVPGDRLWVREAWRTARMYDDIPPSDLPRTARIWHEASDLPPDFEPGRYRHGRFMCRWMSRISLEVTDVRVQRVQDISEEDCKAEGAPWEDCWPTYKQSFEALWDSINAERAPWASNPWVWAIMFKRIAT